MIGTASPAARIQYPNSAADERRPKLAHLVVRRCIKHGGIVDAHYGSGLSFKNPDGIALEFFAPPA